MPRIDGADVRTVGGAVVWVLARDASIDADGAIHAYADAGSGLPSLDYLANATTTPRAPISDKSKWVGVVTDAAGRPVVQGRRDPAPGYLVSTTSLHDPNRRREDPRRYVDSESVAYLAIGRSALPALGARLGDLGWAIDLRTGSQAPLIVADVAPGDSLHEMSIRAARDLGYSGDPKGRGREPRPGEVLILLWPGSRAVPAWPRPGYGPAAAQLFAAWGGLPSAEKAIGRSIPRSGPVSPLAAAGGPRWPLVLAALAACGIAAMLATVIFRR